MLHWHRLGIFERAEEAVRFGNKVAAGKRRGETRQSGRRVQFVLSLNNADVLRLVLDLCHRVRVENRMVAGCARDTIARECPVVGMLFARISRRIRHRCNHLAAKVAALISG